MDGWKKGWVGVSLSEGFLERFGRMFVGMLGETLAVILHVEGWFRCWMKYLLVLIMFRSKEKGEVMS